MSTSYIQDVVLHVKVDIGRGRRKTALKIVHVLKEFTGYSKYTNNTRQSMIRIREVQGGVMEIQSKERMIEATRNGFVEALHLNLVL